MTASKVADPAIWEKRVEALEASGRSCREYAKQIGVNPHTLAGWRWKLRQRARTGATPARPRAAAASEREFVEVTKQVAAALVAETGVIEVELGGAVVRVRGEVDGEMLARVLGAVGGRRG
ncbi:IS66 family insertion sequence element accessory protein TnpA [Nannocystis exedens]|uniref:IS66 family insertion sequence element accessory protein TnpA n=1 Tax=Nannocystis exedens TaxID=54 RepID=UPI000BD27656|nr:transposase [Nannocystis exedens]PCC70109.1 Transposase [Nannocystis exedens]